MSDQTMTLPPLKLYPAIVAGVPVPEDQRRFMTYQSAFIGEYLVWLRETNLDADAMSEYVEALLSAMRQLHEIVQIERCEHPSQIDAALITAESIPLADRNLAEEYIDDSPYPKSLGEIVDEIINRLGSAGRKEAVQ